MIEKRRFIGSIQKLIFVKRSVRLRIDDHSVREISGVRILFYGKVFHVVCR